MRQEKEYENSALLEQISKIEAFIEKTEKTQ